MIEPRSLWTDEDPKLHLLDWVGEGTPLLMTHGMAGNAHWWDRTAPLLVENFKPVALDFHGHGDSQWKPDGRYDSEGFVEDIEAARRALGWERMVLAGHSLGGRIALEYARRRPGRLIGLVAIDFLPEFYESKTRRFERTRSRSQPHYPDEEAIVRSFHLQPPGTLLSEGDLRGFARRCIRKNERGYTWKFDWRAFLYQYQPVWGVLPEIRVPTLVVRGEKSTVMDRKAFERIARSLPGARAVEIPGAHHHVTLDSPRELAREMAGFLSGLGRESQA